MPYHPVTGLLTVTVGGKMTKSILGRKVLTLHLTDQSVMKEARASVQAGVEGRN